jgi:hypothetical protein
MNHSGEMLGLSAVALWSALSAISWLLAAAGAVALIPVGIYLARGFLDRCALWDMRLVTLWPPRSCMQDGSVAADRALEPTAQCQCSPRHRGPGFWKAEASQ